VIPLQPYPELEKQPEWTGSAKPDAIDWDKEIAAATQNKEVPEIDWCQPGEDAALEVLCQCCQQIAFLKPACVSPAASAQVSILVVSFCGLYAWRACGESAEPE
jgi:hypothetical protein